MEQSEITMQLGKRDIDFDIMVEFHIEEEAEIPSSWNDAGSPGEPPHPVIDDVWIIGFWLDGEIYISRTKETQDMFSLFDHIAFEKFNSLSYQEQCERL